MPICPPAVPLFPAQLLGVTGVIWTLKTLKTPQDAQRVLLKAVRGLEEGPSNLSESPCHSLAVSFPSGDPEMAPSLPPMGAANTVQLCAHLGVLQQASTARTCVQTPLLESSRLPTIDSDVKVELGIGGLDECLQGLGGTAALASQDIYHHPHLLGQGARLLRPAGLLRREEVQPPQVADDLLQEPWQDGPH